MALERLIGADAELHRYAWGTPLITGTAAAGAEYKIVALSGTTVFPAGYSVGDVWIGDGTATFSATNSASLGTPTVVAECSSFSFDLNSDEVEVTVLKDSVKKYRKAKTDMSGSVEGITFISSLADGSSLANRFLRIINTSGTNVSTINEIDNGEFYIKAYLQKDDAAGETVVYLAGQVEFTSYNLGAAVADAQSFTANVRFSGNDPMLYTKVIPTT